MQVVLVWQEVLHVCGQQHRLAWLLGCLLKSCCLTLSDCLVCLVFVATSVPVLFVHLWEYSFSPPFVADLNLCVRRVPGDRLPDITMVT